MTQTGGELEIEHSLFLRKNGRWVLAFVPAGATWKQAKQIQAPKDIKGGSTERPSPAAKKWRDETLAFIRINGGIAPATRRSSSPTLRECWPVLLARRSELPKVKASSIRNNRTHLNAQILPTSVNADPNAAIADIPMAEWSVVRACAFVRAVRARVSANHCRNIYSTVCLLWDTAKGVTDESGRPLIGPNVENPFRSNLVVNELPRQKNLEDDDGDPITIPLAAVQALFLAPDDLIPIERRVRYAGAFYTGADDGEIAGWKWKRFVDLPREQMDLPAPISDGEPPQPFVQIRWQVSLRGKLGFASEDTTKTPNRERDIPLHPTLVDAISSLRGRWEQLMRRKPKPDDYVFPNLEGGPARPQSAQLLRNDLRILNAMARGRGEPPLVPEELLAKITFKAFRRTFSSQLRKVGVDEETRGKLMGHAGKTVTARNYTKHELGVLGAVVAKIPLLWRAVEVPVVTANAASQQPSNTVVKAESSPSVHVRRGWDSNPRMTVLQSDPASAGISGEEPPLPAKCGDSGSSADGTSRNAEGGAASPGDAVTTPLTGRHSGAADVAVPGLRRAVEGLRALRETDTVLDGAFGSASESTSAGEGISPGRDIDAGDTTLKPPAKAVPRVAEEDDRRRSGGES